MREKEAEGETFGEPERGEEGGEWKMSCCFGGGGCCCWGGGE